MEKKLLYKVLYYGSLWGIAEATLGYVFHAVPFLDALKIAGSIMFPIGVVFMYQAWRKTGMSGAIILTAIVAAAIKSVNALIPNNLVFGPVIAILSEGLAVYMILPAMLPNDGSKPKILTLFSMGFAVSAIWRIPFMYIPWQLEMNGMWLKGPEVFMPFMTTAVFHSALFIMIFMLLPYRIPEDKFRRFHERFAFVPAGAFSLFGAALLLSYFIG